MANTLTAAGLTLNTREELIAYYTVQYQTIYGPDINLSSDTPDGQFMNIWVQSILDVQDLMRQIYTSFDPDQAFGVTLDERVAINGIQRQAGTPTVTNVSITTTQALNLYGLDQEIYDPYTVSDNEGNKYFLMESVVIASPSTSVLAFQAAVPGARPTTPNTITVPVSIVLGVSTINNPTSYTSLGINEESDAELKIRRQKSVAIGSQGYLAGLIAALENITGVTSVQVYENTTGSTDGDGIPGHSIWVILSGTGAPSDIAKAIYNKRNAGCGLKGAQTFNITNPGGSILVVRWDDVETETLYIKFTATSLDGINPVNYAAILAQLPALFIPGVYEQVNINDLATIIQQIDNNCLVTSAGFSTSAGGTYTSTLTPSAKNKQFAFGSAQIIILPLLLTAPAYTVAHGGTLQFTAQGGSGARTFSISVNNSSGSINSSTGLYTSGGTFPVTDTIRVTDALGNFTNVNVAVT